MRISGPERYKLAFDAHAFAVTCEKGTAKFSGIATTKKPKLYIASVDERPMYVGVTRQPLRSRLRFGWSAAGAGGYYGYSWRHALSEAFLDIWCHEDAPEENPSLDMETVEAEVVFFDSPWGTVAHVPDRNSFSCIDANASRDSKQDHVALHDGADAGRTHAERGLAFSKAGNADRT